MLGMSTRDPFHFSALSDGRGLPSGASDVPGPQSDAQPSRRCSCLAVPGSSGLGLAKLGCRAVPRIAPRLGAC